MIFSSMIFLFFFLPVGLMFYYMIISEIRYRNILLLVLSLLFYAWGEPKYVIIMIASILWNYRVGLWMDSSKEKSMDKYILAIGIFVNLAILFIFKYEGFFVNNINDILGTKLEGHRLVLPIGISFFTFQAISYLIDVYRKEVPVQKSVLNLGLYISFFPQLIAGPIVRYKTIMYQIQERVTTWAGFVQGIRRFIIGLSKKVIFANQFAIVSEASFAATEPSVIYAWLGAIAYTLQIYFDFSGYSDMAIGLGKMFGFEFEENFNYPYISKSVSEFWRRWHISLGRWFRDYVYFPLGGSRVKSKKRLVFNLFVVWMLTGFWHGAAWQFVAWGALYFGMITVEKILNIEKYIEGFIGILYRILTIGVVVVGWVLFGEQSLTHAIHHLLCMLGFTETGLIEGIGIFYVREMQILLPMGIVFATPVITRELIKLKDSVKGTKSMCIAGMETIGYLVLFIIVISYLAIGAHNPFIYFNF